MLYGYLWHIANSCAFCCEPRNKTLWRFKTLAARNTANIFVRGCKYCPPMMHTCVDFFSSIWCDEWEFVAYLLIVCCISVFRKLSCYFYGFNPLWNEILQWCCNSTILCCVGGCNVENIGRSKFLVLWWSRGAGTGAGRGPILSPNRADDAQYRPMFY